MRKQLIILLITACWILALSVTSCCALEIQKATYRTAADGVSKRITITLSENIQSNVLYAVQYSANGRLLGHNLFNTRQEFAKSKEFSFNISPVEPSFQLNLFLWDGEYSLKPVSNNFLLAVSDINVIFERDIDDFVNLIESHSFPAGAQRILKNIMVQVGRSISDDMSQNHVVITQSYLKTTYKDEIDDAKTIYDGMSSLDQAGFKDNFIRFTDGINENNRSFVELRTCLFEMFDIL